MKRRAAFGRFHDMEHGMKKTDGELQRDVMEELQFEPSIDAAEIGVAVEGGVVTLSGAVKSYFEKWTAERAAERVAGVRAVANELEVRLPDESQQRRILGVVAKRPHRYLAGTLVVAGGEQRARLVDRVLVRDAAQDSGSQV